ncbi:hypothetical protein [Flavobacterium degerlachei]|jgi:hypothetical protein|uniref:Uncharacterized protein n=1 Tax=Flavobacterium degerlachei TaxID=229203 RepID=A0A1H2Q4T9_9FLAO|nr:hypothetical protein [Flavobacterium degerlachei]SDW02192.1 hypothetical protein SAMN05444338_10191 [Flavobacterium degerlachei]
MKKITFLVASILLMGGGVANATEKNNLSSERRVAVDFRNAEPVIFTEGGIQFYVFADGEFDFNARSSARDKSFKPNKRGNGNRNYGSSASFRKDNYGVKVQYDRWGNVTRIGNVSIDFDSNDRIKRIGSVQMSYNRFALERVGGLEIIYNRRGQVVDTYGSVKGGRGYATNQNKDYEYGSDRKSNDRDYRSNEPIVLQRDNRVATTVDVRIVKRN